MLVLPRTLAQTHCTRRYPRRLYPETGNESTVYVFWVRHVRLVARAGIELCFYKIAHYPL